MLSSVRRQDFLLDRPWFCRGPVGLAAGRREWPQRRELTEQPHVRFIAATRHRPIQERWHDRHRSMSRYAEHEMEWRPV